MLTRKDRAKIKEVFWATLEPLAVDDCPGWYLLAESDEYWMNWELHEASATRADGTPRFASAEVPCEDSDVPTTESCVIDGFVKWDGCTQWSIRHYHHDRPDDVPDLAALLRFVHETADENMPQYDAEIAGL